MNEMKFADHGIRKYDSDLGRFLCPDAMWDSQLSFSSYHYCYNNPIKLIDENGLLPGDPFESEAQAAHEFGKNYNNMSITEKREFGSSIYKTTINGEENFTYSIPNRGLKTVVVPSLPKNGEKIESIIHSHGSYDDFTNPNEFSEGEADIEKLQEMKIDGFLATPNGSLLMYDFKEKKISLISVNLPSDPKDPNRKNSINASTEITGPVNPGIHPAPDPFDPYK